MNSQTKKYSFKKGGTLSAYSKHLKKEIDQLHHELKKNPNSDPNSNIRKELREKSIKYNASIKKSPSKKSPSKKVSPPPLLIPHRQKASRGKGSDSFDSLSPRREGAENSYSSSHVGGKKRTRRHYTRRHHMRRHRT